MLICCVVREYDNGIITIIGWNGRDTIFLGDVLELDPNPEIKVTVQYMEFLGKPCKDVPISHRALLYFSKNEYPVDFQAGDYLASRYDTQSINYIKRRKIHYDIARATLVREDKEKGMPTLWDENRDFLSTILKKIEETNLIKRDFIIDLNYSYWFTRKGSWQNSWEVLPFLQKEISDTTSNEKRLILAYLMTSICRDKSPVYLPFLNSVLDFLINEFERTNSYWKRWKLGRFIGELVDESIISNVISLLKQRQYRLSRSPILNGFSKMKCRESLSCLIDLLDDPYICDSALVALGARREQSARSRIEHFLHCDDNWLRMKARWALNEINKGQKIELKTSLLLVLIVCTRSKAPSSRIRF